MNRWRKPCRRWLPNPSGVIEHDKQKHTAQELEADNQIPAGALGHHSAEHLYAAQSPRITTAYKGCYLRHNHETKRGPPVTPSFRVRYSPVRFHQKRCV